MRATASRSGALLLAALTVGVAAACGGDGPVAPAAEGGAGPVTVENCGRDLTLDAPAQRVFVIGGEAGTIVHAAGGTDRVAVFSPLVGEPLGDAAGPLGEREQAPIGTAKDMSREAIIAAGPDLVVTFGLSGFTPEDLEAAGIPTYVLSGYCGGFGAGQSEVVDPLEGVYADVEAVGRLVGTSAEADRAAAELRARVDAVSARFATSPPADAETLALFVAGPEGDLGAYGARSMIHQQLGHVGLVNVFADQDERYFEPGVEAVIGSGAQRVVALYEPGDTSEQAARDAVLGRPALASLPAVAAQQVLVLDFFYSGHGTLAVDGLEQLADRVRS